MVKKVVKQEDDEEWLECWYYRNGTINFDKTGDLRVIAKKMPTHLTAIGDSFTDLHRLFHNAVKYYALAWIKENDDPDDPTAQRLYQKFNNKVRRANLTISSSGSPSPWEVERI